MKHSRLGQLRVELYLIGWFEDYLQFALLALDKIGSLNLCLVIVGSSVLDFEGAGALKLNSIVHYGAGS